MDLIQIAALNRVSRLIRRMHLSPTLVSYPRTGKSGRPLCVVSKDPDAQDLDGFGMFEVEQTLFKVHMSLFRLKIWSPADSLGSADSSGNTPADPVILSDTVENFRFFLWDLQAFGDSDVIHLVDRLLSITEMANKHNLSVLETHAVESLRHFVMSPYFHSTSSAQHCRALRIAANSTLSSNLLRDLSHRLIHHTIRRSPRLQKLQGAIYYRQLIDMEQYFDDRGSVQPVFPPMDVERRMRFLAAHNSLSALSARLCTSAPVLPSSGCSSHSALGDILGRLRVMMPLLRRMVSQAPTMSIDCGLAALEAAVALRDEIIDGLLDYFMFA
ncbi:hypothetical protein B0H13DRAFT_2064360 [Mycena leptocephala]|nr:hypothetical protein B0H13DRAFT_2064360 [Mycena leptocephala]